MQQLFDRAVGFFRQGHLAEAEELCWQIFATTPSSVQTALLLGAIRAQQGRHTDALALIGEALKTNPHDAGALLNYGNVLKALGRDEEALTYCDKALAVKPDHAGAWYNRGNILLHLKRLDDALTSYEKALGVRPDFVEAWNNRGMTLHAMQRWDDAVLSYDRALVISPNNAETLNNRGTSLLYRHRHEEALASFDKALEIRPNYPEALNNYGLALRDMNRQEEALACYDRALAIKPDYADAWKNRGNALRDARRFAEAVASYDKALAIDADHSANEGNAEIWNNRGACLYYLNRTPEALASYDKALAIDPDYVKALHSRASIQWKENQNYEAALFDFEKAVFLDPDYDYAQGDLLHVRMHGGDWRGFDEQTALVAAGVHAGKRIADPFIYQGISESPADLRACADIYTEQFHPPAPALCTKAERGHKKIRLGYVSGEFREQATAFLTAGLYECHDRSKFEIVAFDNGRISGGVLHKRLEAAFDRFIPIANLSDRAAAEKILAEEIDILVNLNGYFGDHRMDVFAHRPAPVQVNYLGFPGTLGAGYIDYILADRFVIPPDEQQYYAEKVVYLPDSYQVNDAKRPLAQTMPARSEHRLPRTGIVFCNFNVSYKITPAIFAVWMNILKKVEGSVLWLLQSNTASPKNLRYEAEHHGVAGNRLVFAPFIPMEKQLERLQLADLFLDTMPCNAHTTGSDALWAGVPLVTCTGTTFPGRVATSLLHAVGLPELVTANLADYEALAVNLAGNPNALQAIRQKLAHNRQTAPLFDTDRFRRHIESAYAQMWEIARHGEAPRSFEVVSAADR